MLGVAYLHYITLITLVMFHTGEAKINSFTINQSTNQTVYIKIGEPVIFYCNVSHESTDAVIRIRDESREVIVQATNTTLLTLERKTANCQESGNYSCDVSRNEKVVSEINVYLLVVKCQPQICQAQESPKNVHARIGGNLTIPICVIANPDIFDGFKLHFNGKEITENRASRVSYSVEKYPPSVIHYTVRVFIARVLPDENQILTIAADSRLYSITPYTIKLNLTRDGLLPDTDPFPLHILLVGIFAPVVLIALTTAFICHRRRGLKARQSKSQDHGDLGLRISYQGEHDHLDNDGYNTIYDVIDTVKTNTNTDDVTAVNTLKPPESADVAHTVPALPPRPLTPQFVNFESSLHDLSMFDIDETITEIGNDKRKETTGYGGNRINLHRDESVGVRNTTTANIDGTGCVEINAKKQEVNKTESGEYIDDTYLVPVIPAYAVKISSPEGHFQDGEFRHRVFANLEHNSNDHNTEEVLSAEDEKNNYFIPVLFNKF
ncbi:uncharacterized protein LOC131927394 isoform X2 [Physella acuta]|uniref:uncharacterized protein LOC131927394 isoform X2 n=1 Tax=Physella acuta TaxID=109671 RepID=UPI0027DBF746|nr:uncharacterized protein LOC131927394 isoform X2 [Physella acuta]